jgi:hypothetical protein
VKLLSLLPEPPERRFLRHASLEDWLAAERTRAAKYRRRRRIRRSLVALLIGLLFGFTLLLSPPQAQALATRLPFCGTAAQTLTHFGWPESSVPPADALAALPAPDTPAAESGVSYDLATGQLCAESRQALAAYLPGPDQASGAGATTNAPQADPLTNLVIDAITTFATFSYQSFSNQMYSKDQSQSNVGVLNFFTNLNVMTTTPALDTYQNNLVSQLEDTIRKGLLGAVFLFYALAGLRYMFGRLAGFHDLVPRIFLWAVFAFFSLPLLGLAIEASNSLISDMQTILGHQTWPPISYFLDNDPSGLDDFWWIIYFILAFLLSIEMFLRAALLNLFLVTAPLGIACFASETTKPWGQFWAQGFVSTLIMQPAMLLMLGLGDKFLTTLVNASGLASILIGLASLYMAYKLPKALFGHIAHAMGEAKHTFVEHAEVAYAVGRQVAAMI